MHTRAGRNARASGKRQARGRSVFVAGRQFHKRASVAGIRSTLRGPCCSLLLWLASSDRRATTLPFRGHNRHNFYHYAAGECNVLTSALSTKSVPDNIT